MDDDPAQGLPHHGAGAAPETVRGLAAVRAKVDFDVAAPDELAGLTRSSATLAADGKDSGAVLTYGTGLGSIVVVQWPSRRAGPLAGLPLPEVNVDGGTGKELATALGTIVTFDRDGVSYLVAGFLPPASAENAARGLREAATRHWAVRHRSQIRVPSCTRVVHEVTHTAEAQDRRRRLARLLRRPRRDPVAGAQVPAHDRVGHVDDREHHALVAVDALPPEAPGQRPQRPVHVRRVVVRLGQGALGPACRAGS